MLQYSVYSVISPEGCASILWKTAEKAADAADAMGLTAQRLNELGFVDDLVPEPLGGAHRDVSLMADNLRKALAKQLKRLRSMDDEVIMRASFRANYELWCVVRGIGHSFCRMGCQPIFTQIFNKRFMLLSTLKHFLQPTSYTRHQRLVVAYSGGMDSRVLLRCTHGCSHFHQTSK
jgi:hypothetical protein